MAVGKRSWRHTDTRNLNRITRTCNRAYAGPTRLAVVIRTRRTRSRSVRVHHDSTRQMRGFVVAVLGEICRQRFHHFQKCLVIMLAAPCRVEHVAQPVLLVVDDEGNHSRQWDASSRDSCETPCRTTFESSQTGQDDLRCPWRRPRPRASPAPPGSRPRPRHVC